MGFVLGPSIKYCIPLIRMCLLNYYCASSAWPMQNILATYDNFSYAVIISFQMSSLVDLSSAEGQRLLAEVKEDGTLHQPFIGQIFRKQNGRSNCALQSAALLLNSSFLAKCFPESCARDLQTKYTYAEQLPFAEERMLDAEVARAVTSVERVDTRGATLDELCRIFAAYGCKVDSNHATESSIESFREKCKAALSTNHTGAVVNYHMTTLGQGTFGGHHSPLGAYHSGEDRFLLWDTWPKTEVCWAKTDDLFRAMNTLDQQSNESRGFCIIDTTDVHPS